MERGLISMNSTFLNKVFNFIGVGLALYIIANVYTWLSNDAVIKNTIKCKFCRKRISEKVSRRGHRFLVRAADWKHIGTTMC